MDTDSIRDLNHLKIWCMSMQEWLKTTMTYNLINH